jgi:hypothetical protein
MAFCLLDSQIWRRLSTNTLSSQVNSLFISLCHWTGHALSCIGLIPPELYVPGRHARSSNHSSSLKQFYTLVENFSNMFVAEFVVCLVSAFHVALLGRSAISLTPEECCTRVVSSAHMSIHAQNEHCTWVVSSELFALCPGCLLQPRFTDFSRLDDVHHWQGDFYHWQDGFHHCFAFCSKI